MAECPEFISVRASLVVFPACPFSGPMRFFITVKCHLSKMFLLRSALKVGLVLSY